MHTQFSTLVECRLGLTMVHLHHEVNLIELADEEVVFDGHGL
jgi:hypothetical protein